MMYLCDDFLSSQILYFLVPALTSCACTPAQSPVSAADQQRHQISLSQVAQATAIQDGAHRTIPGRLLVYLIISGESRGGASGEGELCPPPPFCGLKLRPVGPRRREKDIERLRTLPPTPPHLPEGLNLPGLRAGLLSGAQSERAFPLRPCISRVAASSFARSNLGKERDCSQSRIHH